MDYPSCRWNIHGISKIVGAMSHWSSSVEGYLRFVMCFATLFDFCGCFFPDGLLKPMRRFQLTREIRRGDDKWMRTMSWDRFNSTATWCLEVPKQVISSDQKWIEMVLLHMCHRGGMGLIPIHRFFFGVAYEECFIPLVCFDHGTAAVLEVPR